MSSLVTSIHPAFLMGFRLDDWIRLILRHGFDARYALRVVLTTPCTIATSLIAVADRRLMASAEVNEELWRTPVFLLGLPRSGTTQLHYLLSEHDGWTAPTRMEAFNPHTFLSLRILGIERRAWATKATRRVIDNVNVGWSKPEEDDFAIFAMTGIRGQVWRTFPTEASPLEAGEFFAERNRPMATRWKEALAEFTRKLVFAHNARLLLKSPSHTSKIPQILEVFPRAKFVTIFRDPQSHYRSIRSLFRDRGTGWGELRKRPLFYDTTLLETNARQLTRYFETRHLIPDGHLCEIRYEDLNADPAATLKTVFDTLHPEGWDQFQGKLLSRWNGAYRTNTHPELSQELQELVKVAYAPLYTHGIYCL